MPYGIIKVDQVTFTNAGVDQTISVSGIVASISGNITATGTISGDVIRGGTLVSGATVTGTAGQFGTITGNTAGFITVTGTTITGTTLTVASGTFTGNSTAAAFIPTGSTVPTNGVYLPSANNVAISTNGTGRLFVDASGNVGVGISPVANLHVNGTTGLRITGIASKTVPSIYIPTGGILGDINDTFEIRNGGGASSELRLSTRNKLSVFTGGAGDLGGGTEKLTVTSAGLVGVGTSSPQVLLHGTTSVSSSTEYAGVGFFENSLNNVDTSPTTAFPVLKLTRAGKSGATYRSSASLGIARYQDAGTAARTRLDIALGHGDVPQPDITVMSLLSSGAVGVGTTSPDANLDIVRGSSGTVATFGIEGLTANPRLRIDVDETNNTVTFNPNYSGATSPSLVFKTQEAERLRITAAGLVGIGTSSVTGTNTRLEVSNDSAEIKVSSTAAFNSNFRGFRIGITGDSVDYSGIRFQPNSGELRTEAGFATWGGFQTFYTNGLERLRIDSTGKVGIGTTSPDVALHVATGNATGYIKIDGGTSSSATNGVQFRSSSNTYSAEISHYQSNLSLYTAGNERARIDSSGRLLVGTSTAQGVNKFQIQGTTSDSTEWGGLFLRRGLAAASISTGFYLGQIDFGNQDGGVGALIRGEGDAQWGTNDYPGRLVFSTTADGASSPTEAVRINRDQNLMLSQSGSGIFVGTTTDGAFRIGRSSFAVSTGTLYIGNAAIQVSSDIRLKNNIEDTSLNALEAISKIKVKDFTWNDPTDTSYNNRNARGKWTGLIAQELVEVLPFVVNAPRKEEDGSIDYESQSTWTLDQSQLCPVLIKAVQQQQEIIAALEARVAALEST